MTSLKIRTTQKNTKNWIIILYLYSSQCHNENASQELFSNDCRKPNPKVITPITTGEKRAMNQSEFLAIAYHLPKAREKSRVQGAIGFGFASAHSLKNWRITFKAINIGSH